jgi:hypothetical protein
MSNIISEEHPYPQAKQETQLFAREEEHVIY